MTGDENPLYLDHKRIWDLTPNDCGTLDGRLFIVVARYYEGSMPDSIIVRYDDGTEQTFGDFENHAVEYLGKGRLIQRIELLPLADPAKG